MSDDIDEVALNVLLAEGLDLPTAFEASRRDAGGPPEPNSPSAIFWFVVLTVVALGAALLLV